MGVLNNLVPEKVFYYFEELCNIPHGSKNTKAIRDYCVDEYETLLGRVLS